MQPADRASPSDLAGHLLAALTLAERVSSLRQMEGSWVKPQTDLRRAASALAGWKSQRPFTVGAHFENRLRLDGLNEEELLAILGLPSENYSDLFPTSPEWVQDLKRLYSSKCPPLSDDDQFLQWSREGTNAFLWIAFPLIQEGLRRLGEGIQRLPLAGAPFESGTVARLLLPSLFAVMKPAVENVMVLELNVARVRGTLTGELPVQRFRNFCETLRQPEVRWSIMREYPVMFRSLHMRMMNWVEYSLELLGRLSEDWNLIRGSLAPEMEPAELTSISAGAGDYHRRGRSVAILEFSSGFRLIYKPHSLSLDARFGTFLEWVNKAGFEPPFRTLKIIDRGCFGWSEFADYKACSSPAEVERFYQRLGGYLAIFHAFKATDMHFGNLIASGEFPVPVDLETLFHPGVAVEDDPAASAWQSSVLRVMLLPARLFGSETQEGFDISGLGAKDGQYFPAGKAGSWEGEGTDEMRLVHDKAVPVNVAGNRPKLEEQEVEVEEFLEPFIEGFERVYRLMESRCEDLQARGGIVDRFGEDEVRFVGRGTHVYCALLAKALHPDMLRSAIDRDQLFDGLWLCAADLPRLARLIPAELKDLQCGDVPVFIARPNSCDLWTSRGERISDFFEATAMEVVRRGLSQLGAEDLALQTSFIRASIASAGERGPLKSKSRKLQLSDSLYAIDLARAVGDALCGEAFEHDLYASWIGLTPMGSREVSWSLQPLDVSFYSGLSGCSFFLAYLGALTGDQSYVKIARKSVNVIRRQLERQRAGGLPIRSLGGYSGSGGIIYSMVHLGVLWQDVSLIDEAETLAADIPSVIETDRMLDVVGGSAGCIAALAALNAVSPNDRLLNTAVLCGERLLRQQEPQHIGIAWKTEVGSSQPLTGFSHGCAGIAWALFKLAAWSKDPRFGNAAESAIAYERSIFVVEEENWPDFRNCLGPQENQSKPRFSTSWCHGAPGIALARIDSLPYMNDAETREEIRIALRKTAGSRFGIDHCLCHGQLGNLDILQYAAQQLDAPYWNEIGNRLAAETLAEIAEGGCSCGAGSSLETPGLMVGLAGIGYGLLRLAFPERVPSVLVLAPPVLARHTLEAL